VNPNHTPEFCRRNPRSTATGSKAPPRPSPRQAPTHQSAAPAAHTGASYSETASKAAATAAAAATASRLAAATGSAAPATPRSTDRSSANNRQPDGQAKGISALTAAGEWAFASGKHLFSGESTGNDCMIDCIRLAVWGKRSPVPLQHLKALRDAVLKTIAEAPAVLGNACHLATGITITGASQLRVLSALAESQSGSTRSGRMGELEDLCAFVRIVFQGRLGIRVWALSTTGTVTDPDSLLKEPVCIASIGYDPAHPPRYDVIDLFLHNSHYYVLLWTGTKPTSAQAALAKAGSLKHSPKRKKMGVAEAVDRITVKDVTDTTHTLVAATQASITALGGVPSHVLLESNLAAADVSIDDEASDSEDDIYSVADSSDDSAADAPANSADDSTDTDGDSGASDDDDSSGAAAAPAPATNASPRTARNGAAAAPAPAANVSPRTARNNRAAKRGAAQTAASGGPRQ
jgi:hypothetical protein